MNTTAATIKQNNTSKVPVRRWLSIQPSSFSLFEGDVKDEARRVCVLLSCSSISDLTRNDHRGEKAGSSQKQGFCVRFAHFAAIG